MGSTGFNLYSPHHGVVQPAKHGQQAQLVEHRGAAVEVERSARGLGLALFTQTLSCKSKHGSVDMTASSPYGPCITNPTPPGSECNPTKAGRISGYLSIGLHSLPGVRLVTCTWTILLAVIN
jgi:hypothetical protein